jgi:tetratricopeptide (TPR) repeat protein
MMAALLSSISLLHADADVCRQEFDSYKAAVLKDASDVKAWDQLRICTTQLKRWRDAAEISSKVLAKNADSGDAHLLLGISLVHSKDYEKAALEFDNAIRLKPNSALPYYHYGMAELFLNKPADAVKAAQKAIELEPKNALHHSQLAYASLLLDDQAMCETEAKKAVELDPNNVAAYKVLGNLYVKQGKQADADKMFEEAMHANGRLTSAHPFTADKRELPGMESRGSHDAISTGTLAGAGAGIGASTGVGAPSGILPVTSAPAGAPAAPVPEKAPTIAPDILCRTQWEAMKKAAVEGKTEEALTYFSDYGDTREQYKAAFEHLGNRVETIFSNFGELTDCSVVLASASCKATVRNASGTMAETTVRLERNTDRVWRIRSF